MNEKEKKDLLLGFFWWLAEMDMLDNTLCYDPEHQTETFLELLKRKLPNTWEEFCKKFPKKMGECFIQPDAEIYEYNAELPRIEGQDKYLLPNRATAEAVLALCQLIQLRDCYNQGKQTHQDYAKILLYKGEWVVDYFDIPSILVFNSSEDAHLFLENFRDLIEKIKPLYGIKKGGEDGR